MSSLETEASDREEKERPNQSKSCCAQGPAVQQHSRYGKETKPEEISLTDLHCFNVAFYISYFW